MYFPVAEIELNPLTPMLIGLGASLISSPTGVSGGFLIPPISANYLGFAGLAVSPTNYLFNLLAMPSGLWRLHREKRILWGLGGLLFLGSLPGIMAGTVLRCTWLRESASFRIFVGLVLLFLALGLIRDLSQIDSQSQKAEQSFLKTPRDRVQAIAGHYGLRRLKFDFGGQSFSVSTPALLLLAILVGLLGGIYGIGGAAIIAPVLIGFFHLPVYVAGGASMLAGWTSAFSGLISYTVFWPAVSGESQVAPDLALGLLFGLGGLLGVYVGSSIQRYLPSRALKFLLLALISIMAAQNLMG